MFDTIAHGAHVEHPDIEYAKVSALLCVRVDMCCVRVHVNDPGLVCSSVC